MQTLNPQTNGSMHLYQNNTHMLYTNMSTVDPMVNGDVELQNTISPINTNTRSFKYRQKFVNNPAKPRQGKQKQTSRGRGAIANSTQNAGLAMRKQSKIS